MPVKILLADKSITIQKVVEMLFSGREYEVACVSDGETALSEAARFAPDVVLADVDLPRIDGYSFAARLKGIPSLSRTPVILMMSRDDVYDSAKGKQAGIVDNIAKPFESQELIGKVKKALAGAAAPAAATVPPRASASPAAPSRAVSPPAPPKAAAPADIFSIISEAPSSKELLRKAVPEEEDVVYEVEPEVEEVEEPMAQDTSKALPTGPKAVEEMRSSVGLSRQREAAQPEIATFESFDLGFGADEEPVAPPKPAAPAFVPPASPPKITPAPSSVQPPTLPESELRKMAEVAMAKMAKDAFAQLPPVQPPTLPEGELRKMAEAAMARMAKDAFAQLRPVQPPTLPEGELRKMAEVAMAKMAKEAFAQLPPVQPPTLPESELRKMAEAAMAKMAKDAFAQLPPPQPPQISDSVLKAMVAEKVDQAAQVAFANIPQPPAQAALSESDLWSIADEAFTRIAADMFAKTQPAATVSDEALRAMVEQTVSTMSHEGLGVMPAAMPAAIPEDELRQLAEQTISKIAVDVFRDMTPPIPKISDETIRRGIEEAVMKVAREIARDVIEKVAWEVIPQLAEHLIKEEIERLKAEP